jgi:hypothetical protein
MTESDREDVSAARNNDESPEEAPPASAGKSNADRAKEKEREMEESGEELPG